jgi:DNA adenine methylase
MIYVGSKRLIAKEILPIILENRKPGQTYVEPMVGGTNSIIHVDEPKTGSDSNKYLIALLKALQQGWEPPREVSLEMYQDVKKFKYEYPDHLVGYIGFRISFSGKWFGGYNRSGSNRNYIFEGYQDALLTAKQIQGLKLQCCSYDKLELPANSLIYCDPPYEGTIKYKDFFDHPKFWQWCRDKELEGHEVYISEYNAPSDFACIWQKQVNCTLTSKGTNTKPTEKLFKWIL